MNRIKFGQSIRKIVMFGCALAAAFLVILVNAAWAQLYAVDRDSRNLYKVSTSNAALTLVGDTGQSLASLEYRPSNGLLYGFTTSNFSELYRINPTNASATLVGNLGPEFVFEGALVLAPNGIAYATNKGSASAAQLFSINLDNGSTNNIGVISGGDHDINGLAWRSDGMLVGLDRVTNSLLAINPANAASAVIAPLNPVVGAAGGMAAVGDSGFFATAGPASGSNQLYSFNLFTGAHSLVGSFSPTITGIGIGGLALIPIPEPTTFALTVVFAMLVGRRQPRTPHVE